MKQTEENYVQKKTKWENISNREKMRRANNKQFKKYKKNE